MQARAFPESHIEDSGPRPIVAGTDIKVAQIASEHEHLGMVPDDIVAAHGHLTLADVYRPLSRTTSITWTRFALIGGKTSASWRN